METPCRRSRSAGFRACVWAGAVSAVVAAGCSAAPEAGPRGPASPVANRSGPIGPSADELPSASTTTQTEDVRRLQEVFSRRTRGGESDEYPIGPGDVIELSVPAMPEIQDEIVRVGGDGTISLPLLGTIQAGGKTEGQLHSAIRSALAGYMHRPEFSLIVQEHHNRQVGVLGAVAEPGLHPVDSGADTILEMISKAGGLTDDATQRLLFIPVEQVGHDEAIRLAQAGQVSNALPTEDALARERSPMLVKASKPIVVDLEKMNRSSQQLAMSVPVRPGDTIMVLGGGKVFVQGWVAEPGAYPMKRGLTVLAAIAGAGGVTYPAKKNTVEVLRERAGTEQRQVLVVDLEEIEDGRAEDVALREGDIIEVDSTGGKLAAYGVYHFFTNVMRMGLALTPF